MSPEHSDSIGTVSIVTPVYNNADTLGETVTSVLSQTWQDWELWLVDDASSDESNQLIEEFCLVDARIHGLSLPENRGAAAARNLAIQKASGRYIAFLDADDLWEPQKLDAQLDRMREGAGLCFSSYRRIDLCGQVLSEVHAPSSLSYSDALLGNSIGCLTAIYDTTIYGKVLMPDLSRRQDYALWLKLLRQGDPAVGIQECLASYRVRPNSLSSNLLKSAFATWQVFRTSENLGIVQSSRSYYYYVTSAVRKRL